MRPSHEIRKEMELVILLNFTTNFVHLNHSLKRQANGTIMSGAW